MYMKGLEPTNETRLTNLRVAAAARVFSGSLLACRARSMISGTRDHCAGLAGAGAQLRAVLVHELRS